VLTAFDLRVLHYISVARDAGQPKEAIIEHLEAMRADDWRDLPQTPPEWNLSGETVSVAVAASKAYDVATIAVLQRDLQFAQQALQEARQRVDQLQSTLDTVQGEKSTSEAHIHDLQLQLTAARGEVDTLRARLDSYRLAYSFGREHPVNIGVIILVTAVAVAALVIVLLLAVRLAG